MRLFSFLYICLSSILIPFILGTTNVYAIVNLDKKTSGTDDSQISDTLRNVFTDKLAKFDIKEHTTGKRDTLKIRANSSKTILEMDESQHLIINTNKFYYAKNKSELFNYRINSYIDEGIIPEKYYSGYTSITNAPNVLSCDYHNTIPIIGFGIVNTVLSSVTSGLLWNIGLDSNGYITLFKFEGNFEIITKNLSEFHLNAQEKYDQLLPSKSIYYLGKLDFYLFAVKNFDSKSTIDVLIITDTETQFHVMNYTTIEFQNQLKVTQVTKDSNYFYIATENDGLKMISVGKLESTNISNGHLFKNITDIIINKQTLYVINGENKDSNENIPGLYIVDLQKKEFISTTPYISHPYFVKFDYLLENYTNVSSTYYVGIAIDNHPKEHVTEILIELIANLDLEFSPKINKIFCTEKDIHVTDIVTDIYSDYSYIFDRYDDKLLYTLTRGVPNFQDSFNYVRSFKNVLTSAPSQRNDHLFTAGLGPYINVLLIQEENKMYAITNLVTFTQTLECVFHKGGEYIEKVSTGYDCSSKVNGQYQLNGCTNEIEFYINVTEEEEKKRSGLWVALVIGIIVILFIIGGVLFFTFKKKSRSTSNNVEVQQIESQKEREQQEIDYQKGNNEDKGGIEIEEANFDNKY